jgi:hypothetical protein
MAGGAERTNATCVRALRNFAPFGTSRRSELRAVRNFAPFGTSRRSELRALRNFALLGTSPLSRFFTLSSWHQRAQACPGRQACFIALAVRRECGRQGGVHVLRRIRSAERRFEHRRSSNRKRSSIGRHCAGGFDRADPSRAEWDRCGHHNPTPTTSSLRRRLDPGRFVERAMLQICSGNMPDPNISDCFAAL